mmetsp:Transcript_18601/g.37825  ORF Transcript_18601/g.37825 Transcript_18601/m.37825 type:complete len:98 (+) Transcript_18601:229-522(+)
MLPDACVGCWLLSASGIAATSGGSGLAEWLMFCELEDCSLEGWCVHDWLEGGGEALQMASSRGKRAWPFGWKGRTTLSPLRMLLLLPSTSVENAAAG